MPNTILSHVATCEDYNSDASEVLPNTRKQANVKLKRSNPSDLGKDKSADSVGPDVASDSGYSSHTAATMSSVADSQSSKKGSLAADLEPTRTASPAASSSPAKSKRRPAMTERLSTQSSSTSRRDLARSDSARKSRRESVTTCREPNCSECRRSPQLQRARPQQPSQRSPLDSGIDISYAPFDDRARTPGSLQRTPSTRRGPQPTPYMQGPAVIQPAQSRRRSSSAARPASYHADSSTAFPPWAYLPQSRGHQQGPPPSTSAWANMPQMQMQMQPYGMIGQAPHNPSYYPMGQQTSPTSPYDTMRPPLQSRVTDSTYSTRRPTSTYGPPVISYEQPQYGANSMALTTTRMSARYPNTARVPASAFDSDTETSSSDEEEEEEDEEYERRYRDSRAMPPPSSTKIVRRPSNRSENVFAARRQGPDVEYISGSQSQYRDRSRTVTTTSSSRTSSNRRPSIASSNRTKATSYSGNSSTSGNVIVEARGRRISYMGHEKRGELEAKRRDMYSDYADDAGYAYPHYEDRAPQPSKLSRESRLEREPSRRRDSRVINDAEAERRRVKRQSRAAEEYIQTRGGSDRDPLTDFLRSNAVPDTSMDNRTKRTSRALSDAKSSVSKSSAGNRTTMTKDTGIGAIKIGLDEGHNINLQFDGPMDGKTVQIRQNENGQSELVIGSATIITTNTNGSRDNAYVNGSDLRSKVGSRVAPSRVGRDKSESSVSEKSSRKSDKDSRGRRKRKEEDFEGYVHGA